MTNPGLPQQRTEPLPPQAPEGLDTNELLSTGNAYKQWVQGTFEDPNVMGRVRTDYDDYVSVGSSDKSALMHANLKTVVMTRTDRGTLMTETYMLTSEGFVTRTTYEFGHTQAQGAGNGMFVEVGQPLTVFIGQDGLVKLRAEFDELAESQASTDSVRV